MKFRFHTIFLIMLSIVISVSSCGDDRFDEQVDLPSAGENTGDGGDKPALPDGVYAEKYRPLVHFTPAKNWINDPNGMVYADGVWHLFYQYNPSGNDWGNMSWGHATSTDLIKWTEQPVALYGDDLGAIFSGSAVCDKDNTSGFGAGALVALYTSAGAHQQQSLAYSTDGGKTFTKHKANPVIANTSEPDFRDPKVVWHEESKTWIMALAMGWKYAVEFWGSKDLKNWNRLSSFSTDIIACNRGQWECPDLFRMEYKGEDKWVLIVSVNPGGPNAGSGTQYFIGDFDGTTFTADAGDYPLWLDYGMDNYAGVTWSNAPENRAVLIGWMNNWLYAGAVPCSPWRSAMTLPRELKLIEYQGKPLLANTVVKEIETIAGEWKEISDGAMETSGPYQLQVELDITKSGSFSIANEAGEAFEMNVNLAGGVLVCKRTKATGSAAFSSVFSIPSVKSPLNTEGDKMILDIFVDQSSVEIFTVNGSMAQTNLVFPGSIYNQLVSSDIVLKAKYRGLDNIWK